MSAVALNVALELVLALLSKSAEISALIAKAQGEGRTALTAEEWASIEAADAAARQRLVDAIQKAKEAGL